jgi:UDP-3-O-[3-hydroxymyristoyl] glucosamine N-acyltransferase
MAQTVKELAEQCGARIQGGDASALIYTAADITSAQSGQVTQLTSSRYSQYMQNSTATACFVGENFAVTNAPEHIALLICPDPELSFIQAVQLLHPEQIYEPMISPHAVLGNHSTLSENVTIGAYAVIGNHVSIGADSVVLAGVYIGNNVRIGKNCKLFPYAVIYDDVIIGDNVMIHSGAVIGADGFGYKFRNGVHVKVPQVGNVVIEDNVEIGANTCIDRGALGSTVIGAGSKIDNLVQIGHNNKVGKNVIM